MFDTSSDGVMNEAFAVRLLTLDCVVVDGDCDTFVSVTEAEVAVIVGDVQAEAAVPDALVAGVLDRVTQAASLILVDGSQEQEGGTVKALRG